MKGDWSKTMSYVAVAIGGAVGAVLRYCFTYWNVGWFPFGTLAVNWTGCFLLGGFLAATQKKWPLSPAWRNGIGTGMIGSFTTFSTFTVEILELATQGGPIVLTFALVYAGGSVLGGLFLAWAGMVLVRKSLDERAS